ncbi:hypothetical protein DHW03_09155 [Pedobacter yonginense]|uniref:Uncharacterized protein n=1 Tax=Pedobacter yonginense TaxID=651869 RepID=A0A317EQZ7_9SPHI|nr:hypothetical protein [Pedobacter yonginense]PWS27736.1 hypothetical protein DHW03_09155 [Pedobacter yonginense]
MNNTFNINRFGLLLRRQWLDFGKIYLLSLIVVFGVLVGFYVTNIPKPSDGLPSMDDGFISLRFRYPIFGMVGFLFISILASSYFTNLGQKPKAIIDLMTPASVFEKFLAGVFYTTILGIGSYLFIFYITDLVFCKYLNNTFSAFPPVHIGKNSAATLVKARLLNSEMNFEQYRGFACVPVMVTSMFLLGSVYFNRFHYIKTAVSVFIACSIIGYVIYLCVSKMGENMVKITDSGNNEQLAFTIIFVSSAVISIFFWVITYVRLKEKEI